MGLTRFSIYKYVRTSNGWRYCKPVYGRNNKLKPDAVLVDGKEEAHPEGSYYLNVDGQWEKVTFSTKNYRGRLYDDPHDPKFSHRLSNPALRFNQV